jgi:hypothetical protein
VLGVALLAVLAGGCNYLLPLAFLGNPKEKVPPEFDKLAGKRALTAYNSMPPMDTFFPSFFHPM